MAEIFFHKVIDAVCQSLRSILMGTNVPATLLKNEYKLRSMYKAKSLFSIVSTILKATKEKRKIDD